MNKNEAIIESVFMVDKSGSMSDKEARPNENGI